MLTRYRKQQLLLQYWTLWKNTFCGLIVKSTKVIQRGWREFNIRDPITLSRVGNHVKIIRCNVTHVYDADSLLSYIVATGDFHDPIARLEYSNCELMRIDHAVGNHGRFLISKRQVLKSMRENELVHVQLCEAFENEFLNYIACVRSMRSEDLINFSNDIVPQLFQCYENYKMIDRFRCAFFLTALMRSVRARPFACVELDVKVRHILHVFLVYCDGDHAEHGMI